jgi:chromosome segregation ATPase
LPLDEPALDELDGLPSALDESRAQTDKAETKLSRATAAISTIKHTLAIDGEEYVAHEARMQAVLADYKQEVASGKALAAKSEDLTRQMESAVKQKEISAANCEMMQTKSDILLTDNHELFAAISDHEAHLQTREDEFTVLRRACAHSQE